MHTDDFHAEPTPAPERDCCIRSHAEGRFSCYWCGSAINQGRAATPRERYETSDEARQARLRQIEASRRDIDQVDRVVRQVLTTAFTSADRFTYEHLAVPTKLNRMALKYSLLRLSQQGLVKIVGQSKIRPGRYRPLWQVIADSASADDESTRHELIESSSG
jgi:hypothetical protein